LSLRWQQAHDKEVIFLGEKCLMKFNLYVADASISIELVVWNEEMQFYEPMAHATVCVPGSGLEPDQILVKGWSENTGMELALIDAGVIHPEEQGSISTGYVDAGIYNLKL
jgi:hypothetical protein